MYSDKQVTEFQFHNGSIKSSTISSSIRTAQSFNSTMGRLKVECLDYGMKRIAQFQFHNGSIKRGFTRPGSMNKHKFQFHNGSIKSRTNGYAVPI